MMPLSLEVILLSQSDHHMTKAKVNFQPKKPTKELQHLGNFFGTVATVFEGILCFCGGATEETLWFYSVFFAS